MFILNLKILYMARSDLWLKILEIVQNDIKKAHFITWFQGTAILTNADGKLVVGVPNSFAKDWISAKYSELVFNAAVSFDETVKTIEYEVCSRLSENSFGEGIDVKKSFVSKNEKKVRKVRNQNAVTVSKGANGKVLSQMLNGRYNLKNFVVGNDNRLPHAASVAVSNTPGGIYNPLYVYGGVGLGKTHLLQAIGNTIIRSFPDMIVKYLTAERFVTDVVEAIGRRHMQKFKDQYRNVDVLLVDDIQFFARKNSSQQEFFHTFNALYDHNKQIVITSDRPPSELDDLDDRLKSRFGMGMVVELIAPDFETRVAILKQKCSEFQVLIDPDVIAFIATNVQGSVRGLEGVLRAAIAESQLANRVPTIRSVAEIIQRLNKAQEIIGYDLDKRKGQSVKSIDDVIEIVSDYYDVSLDSIKGKDRHKDIMMPRQICMYLIKNELGDSYEKIGSGFGGRNHTTVMHACNKVSDLLQTNVRLVRDINAIKRDMGL